MPYDFNPSLKPKANTFYSPPFQFQRGEGKIKIKKVQRKISLKLKHIFLFFLLLAGLFYSAQKIYLFLISWERLNIKEIQILCPKESLKKEILQLLSEEKLGNILLADIAHLKRSIDSFNWVKEARVRRVFPSSLRIEIKEREPRAFLKKQNYYLIDEEGKELEKIDAPEGVALPLLIDRNNFMTDYQEKIKSAWECLNSFSPLEKDEIEVLDLTDFANVSIQLKENPTRIILGKNEFVSKFELYQRCKRKWENQFGPLDYVDLRLQDRIFIRPREIGEKDIIPNLKKEVE